MTARAFPFEHEFLSQVSTKIVNSVKVIFPTPRYLAATSPLLAIDPSHSSLILLVLWTLQNVDGIAGHLQGGVRHHQQASCNN